MSRKCFKEQVLDYHCHGKAGKGTPSIPSYVSEKTY